MNFPQILWVATENQKIFLLYYISHEHQIVPLEELNNKSTFPVVASNIPNLFSVSNIVSSELYSQLTYLKTHKKIIENMFSLDSK